VVLTLEEMKKIQKNQLEKLEMDEIEALEYTNAETPDGSIKFGKIDNVVKGIHKLANINPNMDKTEFEQLKYSLMQIGQQEPILVYRGLVLDGRHRLKALKELSSDYVLYQELPRNTSLEELKEIVMSKNARRNLSKSQKAIQAYFDWLKNGGSKKEYALKYGTDRTYIVKAETIDKKLGREKLGELLNYGKVKLDNGRYYSNLSSIIDYLKKKEKKEKKIKEFEPIDEFVKKIANEIKNKEPDLVQLAELRKYIDAYIEKQLKQ